MRFARKSRDRAASCNERRYALQIPTIACDDIGRPLRLRTPVRSLSLALLLLPSLVPCGMRCASPEAPLRQGGYDKSTVSRGAFSSARGNESSEMNGQETEIAPAVSP